MKAQASTRFVGRIAAVGLFAIGMTPPAGAMELNQGSAPSSTPASTFSLPVFLDGARLPDLQDAWRAHFAGDDSTPAPAAAPAAEPEATTINEARQTLTRAEQVSRDAEAVRDRAEELSRRFAVDGGDGTEAPAPDPSPAPVSPDAVTTETAAATLEPSTGEAAGASPVPVSASTNDVAAATEPAPATASAQAPASDDAPVIEDMATPKPVKSVKRPAPQHVPVETASTGTGLLGSLFPVDPEAPKPQDESIPSGLRSFGWNNQP